MPMKEKSHVFFKCVVSPLGEKQHTMAAGSSPLRSILNTNVITCLDMRKVCTEAVHSVALWTRMLSQILDMCTVQYVPKQSIAYHRHRHHHHHHHHRHRHRHRHHRHHRHHRRHRHRHRHHPNPSGRGTLVGKVTSAGQATRGQGVVTQSRTYIIYYYLLLSIVFCKVRERPLLRRHCIHGTNWHKQIAAIEQLYHPN